jgi:hypothetical protein
LLKLLLVTMLLLLLRTSRRGCHPVCGSLVLLLLLACR